MVLQNYLSIILKKTHHDNIKKLWLKKINWRITVMFISKVGMLTSQMIKTIFNMNDDAGTQRKRLMIAKTVYTLQGVWELSGQFSYNIYHEQTKES